MNILLGIDQCNLMFFGKTVTSNSYNFFDTDSTYAPITLSTSQVGVTLVLWLSSVNF